MQLSYGVVSDIGTTRTSNQDFAYLHVKNTIAGEMVLAAVCDGMGGLLDGERASRSMITHIEKWYEEVFPILVEQGIEISELKRELESLLIEHNEYLIDLGKEKNIQMGTTVSILIIFRKKYLGIHVGDSRIYAIEKRKIKQLTNDHTRVMQDVRRGILTEKKAKYDRRRNQLLQCIGVRGEIQPEFFEGDIKTEETFLLCSDGFVHEVSDREIWKKLKPNRVRNNEKIQENLRKLVELVIQRGETDNITAVTVRMENQ